MCYTKQVSTRKERLMKKAELKTLWELFVIFFKAGTFTFAGGLAMLPVIEKDVVEKYKLVPKEDFLEYATLAQTLPGVIAVNCASFIGKRAAGTKGMLIAGLGATFSAFVLMIVATILLQLIPQQGPVVGAFKGIRAASAALVLSAAFTLGRYNLKSAFAIVVMLASFALVFFADISAVIVIAAAGIAGYIYHRIKTSGKGEAKQ
jgi:chromate transporter